MFSIKEMNDFNTIWNVKHYKKKNTHTVKAPASCKINHCQTLCCYQGGAHATVSTHSQCRVPPQLHPVCWHLGESFIAVGQTHPRKCRLWTYALPLVASQQIWPSSHLMPSNPSAPLPRPSRRCRHPGGPVKDPQGGTGVCRFTSFSILGMLNDINTQTAPKFFVSS